MGISSNFLRVNTPLNLSPDGASENFKLGSIISSAKELKIVYKEGAPQEKFEQIGQLIDPEKLVLNLNRLKETRLFVQFVLQKDEKSAKKPRNLGEKKTQTKTKVLKRTIKDKPEYFWRNIGWKILKSLQSLFS